jgi:hypothetical protein
MRGKVLGWLAGLMPLAGLAEPPSTLPSAAQVLDVLQLADTDPAALIKAFEALGFDVIVEADSAAAHIGAGVSSISLDLWQAGQPFAHVVCLGFGPADIDTLEWGSETEFDRAAMQPFSGGIARRIVCGYDYWNPESLLTPFIVAATDWADQNIGPMQTVTDPFALRMSSVVNPANIGSDAPWAMRVGLFADGDEGQMNLMIIRDVPSPIG